MANGILAGEPLSRNDLLTIVQILEQSFDYYVNHNSPFFPEYLQALRTLIGLGFAAALADKNLLYVYQSYLGGFLMQEEIDFKVNPGTNRGIAQSIAEMIHIASICFYALKFPRYYTDFIAALHTILVVPGLGEQKEAKRIVEQLAVT
jgi:hypothetical protein